MKYFMLLVEHRWKLRLRVILVFVNNFNFIYILFSLSQLSLLRALKIVSLCRAFEIWCINWQNGCSLSTVLCFNNSRFQKMMKELTTQWCITGKNSSKCKKWWKGRDRFWQWKYRWGGCEWSRVISDSETEKGEPFNFIIGGKGNAWKSAPIVTYNKTRAKNIIKILNGCE